MQKFPISFGAPPQYFVTHSYNASFENSSNTQVSTPILGISSFAITLYPLNSFGISKF